MRRRLPVCLHRSLPDCVGACHRLAWVSPGALSGLVLAWRACAQFRCVCLLLRAAAAPRPLRLGVAVVAWGRSRICAILSFAGSRIWGRSLIRVVRSLLLDAPVAWGRARTCAFLSFAVSGLCSDPVSGCAGGLGQNASVRVSVCDRGPCHTPAEGST